LGEQDIPVHFAGVEFSPGDYLYADPDGIVVTSSPFNIGLKEYWLTVCFCYCA